jgi:hypothetical protein
MTPPVSSLNVARISKTTRIRDLEAEVARLKRIITPEGPINRTLDTWEALPVELRDRFAAEAIFQNNGDAPMALSQLGFQIKGKRFAWQDKPEDRAEMRELHERVLNTPGVQVLLRKNMEDAEEHRRAIMAGQVELALRGTPDQKIRATQNVAKLVGWLKEESTQVHNTVNMFAISRDGEQRAPTTVVQSEAQVVKALAGTDPLALLAHTPGKPVRIDSGSEALDAILANVPVPDDDELTIEHEPLDDDGDEGATPNVSLADAEDQGWL